MVPVLPCSTNNISLVSGATFKTWKNRSSTRCCVLRKPTKRTLYTQEFLLISSPSTRLFPHIRTCSLHCRSRNEVVSATGVDVAVEQADSFVADKDVAGEDVEVPSDGKSNEEPSDGKSNEESSISSKRSRPARKSDMPPVKNEDLVPGATFTGKVRSIQPFGAFVDFGAFSDGLVHVSRLSDTFVKDVGSVVSVGQEVKVKLVEANIETGRIALSMRESDDNSEKAKAPRRNPQRSSQKRDEVKKTSKFVKGQELEGTVKNLTRAGAFISLPEGEEGFLPTSEEADEGFGNIMGASSLEIGQEVSVRVLRMSRGQVTLTMKKDVEDFVPKIQGTIYAATNPFLLAFRKNKDIASFLDEKEKVQDAADSTEGLVPSAVDEEVEKDEEEAKETQNVASDTLDTVDTSVPSTIEAVEVKSDVESVETIEETQTQVPSAEIKTSTHLPVEDESLETEPVEQVVSDSLDTGDVSVQSKIEEALEVKSGKDSVETISDGVQAQMFNAETEATSSPTAEDEKLVTGPVENASVGIESDDTVVGETQTPTLSTESEIFSPSSAEDEKVETGPAEKSSTTNETQILASETVEVKSDEESLENVIDESQADESEIVSSTAVDEKVEPVLDENTIIVNDEQIQVPTEENELSSPKPVEGEKINPAPESSSIASSSEQKDIPISQEGTSEESPGGETVEFQVDSKTPIDEAQIQTSHTESPRGETVEFQVDSKKPMDEAQIQASHPESPGGETVEFQVDSKTPMDEAQIQTSHANEENPSPPITTNENSGPSADQNVNSTNSNGQISDPSPTVIKAKAISPALVKQLREETGAGMMDCKKALSESGGDIVKAQEYLRKKGLASADKKASRATAEGRIGSYIHDGRIGVLIEVNCETDFVSRGEIFKELVDDLAMQVAACPQVQFLVTEDVPQEIVEKEREIEMQKEDLQSKPEQFRSKIVDGRINKRLQELALLEQPYIKNDKVVVKDYIKQTIATIGENMKVNRFVRFNLGEGLEKKSQDFAAEVAAQTSAKGAPSPVKEKPATVEAKETDEKAPKVTVSAALVKQLREESGAGMMDCKKALSETGGDLEKAQEYLRKKGLSTADKKSSRIAAEGRIGSYIHDSRIGVLIEVNCETDFVGRSEKFKELVDDLAMQVVACPGVEYVSVEDIPESILSKEKEVEMQREDILSKPENIRAKIVEGRVSKRLGELALLEQPFIKDDSVLVKDYVKQTVAAIGENIKVRRFIRFTLGEAQ